MGVICRFSWILAVDNGSVSLLENDPREHKIGIKIILGGGLML